jgi:hypothetical protein
MNNSKQWSSATPGYIVFLVDQSGSMSEDYTKSQTKAQFTALVINRTINDLILTNSAGDKIKDRVFISIIGFGGSGGNSVDNIRSDYLSAFAEKPLRMEKLKKLISDGAGGLVEIDEELPIFIEPNSNGLTPMGEAIAFAKQLIESWITKKPDNPAPVIINISDGFPYEGDGGDEPAKTIRNAQELLKLSTLDGNPLIFSVHIGDGSKELGFVDDESQLPDEQAKLLFQISSKVPESYKEAGKKFGFNLSIESRGFVSNAGPETLIKFINFGSSGGDRMQ